MGHDGTQGLKAIKAAGSFVIAQSINSSDFEAMEEVYITLGKSDSDTGTVYKMMKKEQQLLETFMIGRNQMNLMSKCNIDKNGKARNYDPATNRPKELRISYLAN